METSTAFTDFPNLVSLFSVAKFLGTLSTVNFHQEFGEFCVNIEDFYS